MRFLVKWKGKEAHSDATISLCIAMDAINDSHKKMSLLVPLKEIAFGQHVACDSFLKEAASVVALAAAVTTIQAISCEDQYAQASQLLEDGTVLPAPTIAGLQKLAAKHVGKPEQKSALWAFFRQVGVESNLRRGGGNAADGDGYPEARFLSSVEPNLCPAPPQILEGTRGLG